MKRVFAVLFVLFAMPLFAEEQNVSLKLPDDFVASLCPKPVWKGSAFVWKGVSDTRDQREIGAQTRKNGKDPVLVFAEPPLDQVVGQAVPKLLTACGLKLDKEGKGETDLSLEIHDFYAGVEKRLFTGKGKTHSDFQFVFKKNGDIIKTVNVGYEVDEKKIRQRDVRQLEGALNDLLRRTLEQIPRLDGLKDL